MGSDPVVDGGFLPDQPRTLFDAGHFAQGALHPRLEHRRGHALLPRHAAGDDRSGVPGGAPGAVRRAGGRGRGDLSGVELSDAAGRARARVRRSGPRVRTYDTARRAAAGGAARYLYNFAREIPIPVAAAARPARVPRLEIVYVFGSITPPTPDDADARRDDAGLLDALRAQRRSRTARARSSGRASTHASDRRINLDVELSVVTGFRRARVRVLVERLRRGVRGRLAGRRVRRVTGQVRPVTFAPGLRYWQVCLAITASSRVQRGERDWQCREDWS